MTPEEAMARYNAEWPALNAAKEAATTREEAKKARQMLSWLSKKYAVRHELTRRADEPVIDPEAAREIENLRRGLENCRLLAARHREEDWALLILGFCAEAGVVGSVTR
jgi:hypothetical protein